MKAKQFKELLKEYKDNLQGIIYLYHIGNIYLTQKQIERVIKLRGERKYPHYEIKEGRQVIKYV